MSDVTKANVVEQPRVSVIVPARNEEAAIENCVRSILEQQVDGGLELLVADGGSSDRTAELALATGATVVPNPDGTTPAGLNCALARARGNFVVRFDAHAEMPPGYVAACIDALAQERGPACVGGWRRVVGEGPWGRAAAAALASRVGVGNARLWRPPHASDRIEVETVALGCWGTEHLRAAGGWNERFLRNQDYELNHRLRSSGGRVVFDPRIWSVYHPRESYAALLRQYWDYGRFKALMLTEDTSSLQPRQLAPIGLLATFAATAVPRSRPLALCALVVYAAGLGVVAARSRAGWRTAATLASMHVAWGTGLVAGLGRLAWTSRRSRDAGAEGTSG